MKNLKMILIAFLISSQAFAGLPPTTGKGQRDTAASVTFNFQAPKKQMTRVNGTTALIETGNGNYIANPGIESGSTTGYSLGTAALTNGIPTGTPTFGSGAAGTLSIAATSTTPVADSYSLNYISSAATTAGNFVATDPFTVDPEGQGKVLQYKISYQYVSGTLASTAFSGTSSNYFGVAFYDVTNSSWIPCAGNFNVVQSSGVGIASGTCQTNITTASGRLVWYNVSASSGAITMKLDNFFLGPQITASGVPASGYTAFTTTLGGFGNGTASLAYARVADTMFIKGTLVVGSSLPTSVITFSLPSWATADYSSFPKGATGVDAYQSVGVANAYAGAHYQGAIQRSNTSTTNFAFAGDSGLNDWTATVPVTWAAGHTIRVEMSVPIVGWAANTVMSADTDTRVVAARYTSASTTNLGTGAETVKDFGTVDYDTHAAVTTGASWKYTAPVSGFYKVAAFIGIAANATGQRYTALRKNGTVVSRLFFSPAYATYGGNMGVGTASVQLNAGDYIDVVAFQDSGGNLAYNGLATQNWIAIERVSGSATVAASESVNASYSTAAGPSISTSTQTIVNFGTSAFDSHSAVTTGASWKFTAPSPGKYRVSATVDFRTYNSASTVELAVFKNGSSYRVLQTVSGQATSSCTPSGSTLISLNAGDYIDIRAYQTSGGSKSLSTDGAYNHVSIERVGN
jgi:hypothetical protein